MFDWEKWSRVLRGGVSTFALLPARCVLCGAQGDAHLDLCAGCRCDLKRNESACERCALPLPLRVAEVSVCGACQRKPPRQVAAFAPLLYRHPVDQLVQRLKFRGDLACGRVLATLLRESLPARWPAMDCVVPMPLAHRRLRTRGFNQAQELARGLPWLIMRDGLRRVRETAPQAELDARARRANVRGAFVGNAYVRGRAVVLIDDVITTGATMAAATHALLRSGAREVRVLAVARAPRPGA